MTHLFSAVCRGEITPWTPWIGFLGWCFTDCAMDKSPWKTRTCWWFLLFTFYPWSMDHPKLGLVCLLVISYGLYHGKSLTIVHQHLGNILFNFFQTPFPSKSKVQSVVCFENPRVVANGGWLVRNFVVSFAPEVEQKGCQMVKRKNFPPKTPLKTNTIISLEGTSSSKPIIFWLHGVLPESMEWVKQEHLVLLKAMFFAMTLHLWRICLYISDIWFLHYPNTDKYTLSIWVLGVQIISNDCFLRSAQGLF